MTSLRAGATTEDRRLGGVEGGVIFGFNRRTGSEDAPRWTADQTFIGESGKRGKKEVADDGVLRGIVIFSRRCHVR
jgi:hypothetical protein